MLKTYFHVFGLFSKLRACSVSVVASGVFLYVGKSVFSSKAVWRGLGSPKLMYFWKNGLLETHLGVLDFFLYYSPGLLAS